jgi:hypothetical protein
VTAVFEGDDDRARTSGPTSAHKGAGVLSRGARTHQRMTELEVTDRGDRRPRRSRRPDGIFRPTSRFGVLVADRRSAVRDVLAPRAEPVDLGLRQLVQHSSPTRTDREQPSFGAWRASPALRVTPPRRVLRFAHSGHPASVRSALCSRGVWASGARIGSSRLVMVSSRRAGGGHAAAGARRWSSAVVGAKERSQGR